MRSIEAVKILHDWDMKGRYLFRSRDLGLLFGERGNTLRATIKRLLADEVLERVAHDAYLYGLSCHKGGMILYDIASFLKPGEFSYESFESAASQWGIVSQVPLGRITVATTGLTSEEDTPYGVVEFTHVDRSIVDAADGAVSRAPRCPLPIASKRRAVEDMVRLDRSTELIDWEEVESED